MKKRSTLGRIVCAVLLMLGLVLTVTACGKTESKGDGAEKNAEDVVYKVACEPTFPPFEYKDIETDKITGFDIDLIKAIAAESDIKVEIQGLGFDALIPALQSGTIDVIASGMTIDEKRKLQVDFTEPYINSGLALAVAKANNIIKSEADLQGATVAVQIATTGAKKGLIVYCAKLV